MSAIFGQERGLYAAVVRAEGPVRAEERMCCPSLQKSSLALESEIARHGYFGPMSRKGVMGREGRFLDHWADPRPRRRRGVASAVFYQDAGRSAKGAWQS